MFYKSFFLVLLLAVGLLAANNTAKPEIGLQYDIGDSLPHTILLDKKNCIRQELNPIIPTNARLCPAKIDGITYYFSRVDTKENDSTFIISMIIVLDSAFETPEHLAIGQPFTNALPYSDNQIVQMYMGCKVYAKLPSGWNAAYNVCAPFPMNLGASEAKNRDSIPITERRIEYFFKIMVNSWYSEVENASTKKIKEY